MKPKSIRYGFTKNTGNYQNARLDFEVELEEGDSPDDALSFCRDWVHDRLPVTSDDLIDLRADRRDLENGIQALKRRHERVVAVLQTLNIPTDKYTGALDELDF